MPGEIFTFGKQLEVGNLGESFFLKTYKGSTKSDGRKYDLVYEGKTVELKSDSYPLQKTANYFMERYGSIEDKKEGGPWRAYNDKVDYFVYLYIANKKFFWFEPAPLVKFLNTYTENLRGKTVYNKSYTTLGFCVPRDDVAHLLVREDEA